MPTSVGSERRLLLYADDSTILFSITIQDTILTRLGKEVESCSIWPVIKLNVFLFGSKRKLSIIDTFTVVCNN